MNSCLLIALRNVKNIKIFFSGRLDINEDLFARGIVISS